MTFDIIKLYPFVSIHIAPKALTDQLNIDKDNLIRRTKLYLKCVIFYGTTGLEH